MILLNKFNLKILEIVKTDNSFLLIWLGKFLKKFKNNMRQKTLKINKWLP